MIKSLSPLFILYFLSLVLMITFNIKLTLEGFDVRILIGANTLFFVLSMVSFYIQRKGMMNRNPHVFVRSVSGAMMLKMFITVIAVFAYVYLTGSTYSKRTVFVSLFLYLVYLAVEVVIVMKMNKRKHA